MNWGLYYILQGLKPNTFEELATHAHDMELSMISKREQRLPTYEAWKDKDIEELHSGGKFASEDEFEESMYVSTLLNA